MNSNLQAGIIAGGKETKGRQTVFLTPLDPFWEMKQKKNAMMIYQFQEKWTKSKRNVSQGAVCWVNLAKAQEQVLQFLQTRSHAIIFHDSVPADCIEKWYAFEETKFCIRG